MFTTIPSEVAQCLKNSTRKDTKAAQCQMLMDKSQRSTEEIFKELVQQRLVKHLKPAVEALTFSQGLLFSM